MKHPLEIIAVLIIAIGAVTFILRPHISAPVPTAPKPSAGVTYSCDGGRSIAAAFYTGVADKTVVPGQPPHPTGSVTLNFSDGRVMTLAQTISADGARYANFDESFVFWGKGNGALVLEGGEEKSFVGCTTHTGASVAEPHTYTNSAMGFSLRLPAGYTTNVIDTRGDVVLYSGIVRFAVPAALVQGTNLGADTYLSVEEIPGQQTCEASAFFFDSLPTHTVTDNGVTYSVASSSDAGAGNRYNETVYALRGTRSCLGVRYHIHYSVFENYPAGTVKKFDEPALIKQFDAIRRTLVVTK